MVCLGFLSYAAAAMAAIEQSFAGEPELAPVMMMYAGPFHTGSIVGNMGVNAVKNLDGDGDGQVCMLCIDVLIAAEQRRC